MFLQPVGTTEGLVTKFTFEGFWFVYVETVTLQTFLVRECQSTDLTYRLHLTCALLQQLLPSFRVIPNSMQFLVRLESIMARKSFATEFANVVFWCVYKELVALQRSLVWVLLVADVTNQRLLMLHVLLVIVSL